MVPDFQLTLSDVLLAALWLLVLPVVIPMITGGIGGWFIDGMRVIGGILLGVPIGMANIVWHFFWTFLFWKVHIETFDAIQASTPFEDTEFQVVLGAVGMTTTAAFMVGLMLLVGHLQKKHNWF